MFNKSRTVDAAPKNFKIDNKSLEYTENFKILGLTMNSNLKWYDHITAMVKKAYKKIWMLVRMKLNQVPTKDLLLMYKLKIRNTLEQLLTVYAGTITVEQSARLETVQKKCLTCIFGRRPKMYRMKVSVGV